MFSVLWIFIFWTGKRVMAKIVIIAVFIISAYAIMYTASIAFKSPFSSGEKSRIRNVWQGNHLRDQFKNVSNERLMAIDVNFAEDPKLALKNIAKHPIRFLSVAAQIYPLRCIGYLSAYQFGFFDLVYMVNSAKWPNNFMSTLEFYFTLFFIYGLIMCLRRWNILASPVFLMLAFALLIFAVIFCHITIRQRAPATPILYLIGGYGLALLIRQIGALRK